jgi:predicted transcriptional regulator
MEKSILEIMVEQQEKEITHLTKRCNTLADLLDRAKYYVVAAQISAVIEQDENLVEQIQSALASVKGTK